MAIEKENFLRQADLSSGESKNRVNCAATKGIYVQRMYASYVGILSRHVSLSPSFGEYKF